MKNKELIQDLGNLIRLEQNLRKSINKNISNNTLQTNLAHALQLYEQIDKNLLENQEGIPDSEFFTYIKQARNAVEYIRTTVKSKQSSKMTTSNAIFDAKLAASILIPFDGDSEKLSAFIDGVKFLQTVIKNEQHPTLKLFLMTRISGRARDALPNDNANRSIDEMVELIKNSCESKATTEQVIAKLKGIKRGLPKQQYCEEVEALCNKLANIYVKENVPHATAKKLATKAGLDTLINIVPNENAKLVLQAGTYTTIEQAIQKLNELPDRAENSDNINRVFNVNSNQRRYQYQSQQRGNWRRGVNHNSNNFTPRGFHSNNQRYNNLSRYNNRPSAYNGNYRGARVDNRGHPHQGRQASRIYLTDCQTVLPMQNAVYNQPPCGQNQGQPNWNMIPQQQRQQQQNQPQNQPFLGTVGQYTQSM